jgi:hypothetical protein
MKANTLLLGIYLNMSFYYHKVINMTVAEAHELLSFGLVLILLYSNLLRVLYTTYFLILWAQGKETLANLPKYINALQEEPIKNEK